MHQSDSIKNKNITDLKSQKKAVSDPVSPLANFSVSNQVRQKGGLQKVSFWLRYSTEFGQESPSFRQ